MTDQRHVSTDKASTTKPVLEVSYPHEEHTYIVRFNPEMRNLAIQYVERMEQNPNLNLTSQGSQILIARINLEAQRSASESSEPELPRSKNNRVSRVMTEMRDLRIERGPAEAYQLHLTSEDFTLAIGVACHCGTRNAAIREILRMIDDSNFHPEHEEFADFRERARHKVLNVIQPAYERQMGSRPFFDGCIDLRGTTRHCHFFVYDEDSVDRALEMIHSRGSGSPRALAPELVEKLSVRVGAQRLY